MEEQKIIKDYGQDEWSMPGYKVVGTKHYITRSISFSPNKQKKITGYEKERSLYPDPAKYGETSDQIYKKY
jgi:hypothetical protein